MALGYLDLIKSKDNVDLSILLCMLDRVKGFLD
jgi:hypothetical protein